MWNFEFAQVSERMARECGYRGKNETAPVTASQQDTAAIFLLPVASHNATDDARHVVGTIPVINGATCPCSFNFC